MPERPEVPAAMVRRIGKIMRRLPDCYEEAAWVGVRWRVGADTVAHVFGGEDQLFRITFRAEPDEVMAFEHLGGPTSAPAGGATSSACSLDEDTDWSELAELLTDSFCLQAPVRLAAQVRTAGASPATQRDEPVVAVLGDLGVVTSAYDEHHPAGDRDHHPAGVGELVDELTGEARRPRRTPGSGRTARGPGGRELRGGSARGDAHGRFARRRLSAPQTASSGSSSTPRTEPALPVRWASSAVLHPDPAPTSSTR